MSAPDLAHRTPHLDFPFPLRRLTCVLDEQRLGERRNLRWQ
jgi:hypothetical protein